LNEFKNANEIEFWDKTILEMENQSFLSLYVQRRLQQSAVHTGVALAHVSRIIN